MALPGNNQPPHEQNRLAHACLAAADALQRCAAAEGDGAALLAMLGYDDAAKRRDDANLHRSRLLQAAGGMVRLFQLRAPDAPGLAVFGGEIDLTEAAAWYSARRQSTSGTGFSQAHAFEACVGEGVEFLSGLEHAADSSGFVAATIAETGADAAMSAAIASLLCDDPQPAEARLDWAPARRLSDAAPVLLPADLCYRRDPARRVLTPPGPQSIGCAAAPTFAAAVLHGLLELVERDAAALWWRGGRPGRGLSLEHAALQESATLLRSLRAGMDTRRSWLLNITTDLGIPVVAAMSVAPDGRGFCCGTAARTTLADACQAALREMCQMELAHHVVQAKRFERGDAGLNQVDLGHLKRFSDIDLAACELLHPVGWSDLQDPPDNDLPAVVDRLVRGGLQPCAIDLTRPELAIPVARVMCPGLEQEPSSTVGARLRTAMAETGGGSRHHNNISLL
jgi:ribosomal protein S12 methylthiotransferase accessory factor